ncbi:MAG: hypothetical protein U5J63_04655 [Fodinibius sp.]|nr:hypothetical protein [Fodinibius sp.]
MKSISNEKKTIPTQKGKWFVVGVEAYQSPKEKTRNAVLSFVDITDLKVELEQKVEAEKQLQREILDVEKKERWRLGQFLHAYGSSKIHRASKCCLISIDPKLQQLDEETRMELKKIKRIIVKTEKSLRAAVPFGST